MDSCAGNGVGGLLEESNRAMPAFSSKRRVSLNGYAEEGRELAENEGGADIGVTGEGEFGGAGEDADGGAVGGFGGWENEGRF